PVRVHDCQSCAHAESPTGDSISDPDFPGGAVGLSRSLSTPYIPTPMACADSPVARIRFVIDTCESRFAICWAAAWMSEVRAYWSVPTGKGMLWGAPVLPLAIREPPRVAGR